MDMPKSRDIQAKIPLPQAIWNEFWLSYCERSITAIAHAVGYQSHTQFSREYGRHFGLSPSSDQKNITLLRNI